jgi:hypothetical protein
MIGLNFLKCCGVMIVVPKSKKCDLVFSTSDRRYFLQYQTATVATIATTCISPLQSALAETGLDAADSPPATPSGDVLESLKPFAPVSALVPATRARLWIEEAYQISSDFKNDKISSGQEQVETLERLNTLLSNRPKLFRQGEMALPRVGFSALAQFTAKKTNLTASNQKNVNDNYNYNSNGQSPFASGPSLTVKVSTVLNQADVARQWGILQAQESSREAQNEFRAAFNFYTQQLEFNPSSYEWKASAEEKKRRIRNDQLPTPQAVIVSDLDLRDLYRNQILTALDDATAEVYFRLRQARGNDGKVVDVSDTVDLITQAHDACTKWFEMIDPRDVREAEIAAKNEQSKQTGVS